MKSSQAVASCALFVMASGLQQSLMKNFCMNLMVGSDCAPEMANFIVGHSKECFEQNSNDEVAFQGCTKSFCESECSPSSEDWLALCISHANPLFTKFINLAHPPQEANSPSVQNGQVLLMMETKEAGHEKASLQNGQELLLMARKQAADEEAQAVRELQQAHSRLKHLNLRLAARADKEVLGGDTKRGQEVLAKLNEINNIEKQVSIHLQKVAGFKGMVDESDESDNRNM